MDDEFEEKVIWQICNSNLKLISRITLSFFTFLNKMPKNLSFMHFRPDLFLLFLTTVIFLLICAYFQFQVTEINTSNLFKRIYWNPPSIDASFNKAVKNSWEEKLKASASFAIQGRRATMEDR